MITLQFKDYPHFYLQRFIFGGMTLFWDLPVLVYHEQAARVRV